MDTDALKQIQDRLAELPADVRSAIQDADLDKKIQAVGAKNNLHIDQIGELGDEVMLAMLGFSPLETLGARLAQVLSLPPAAGEKLAADIGSDIFGPIRDSMKAWAAGRQAPAQQPSAQPPAAAQPPAQPAAAQTQAGSKPPLSPAMQKADVMLSQPTVSPALAPENPIYKSDPYREPVN